MQDTLEKYGHKFQFKVINSLLSDVSLLESLYDAIDVSFFESDVNKWVVGVILKYFKEFRIPPTMEVYKSELLKLDDAVFKKRAVDILKDIYTIDADADSAYIKKEFTNFCKNQAIRNAIMESIDLLKIGNYDHIRTLIDKSIKVGVDNNIGHKYKEDFDIRSEDLFRKATPTGWASIDRLMSGGLSSGELGVVVAPSGIGKSWMLSVIGANAVKQGLTVAHYTLELSEYYVGKRYDTIFTQIPSDDLAANVSIVKGAIKNLPGKLIIKSFPPKSVGVKSIEGHVEKMRMLGYKPDVIVVDYADLLLSGGKSDLAYAEMGAVYIELRAMSSYLGIPCWTASQTNRTGINAEVIEADKIADSYLKVMNADFLMSLSRTKDDKTNHTARVHIMKNRFGADGMTFNCKMNTNVGVIDIGDSFEANSESTSGIKDILQKKYTNSLG